MEHIKITKVKPEGITLLPEKDVSPRNEVTCNSNGGNPFKISCLQQPPTGDILQIASLKHPVDKEYAITVNICPDKYMNRKKWKTYTHDQQRDSLLRINKSIIDKVFNYLDSKHQATYDRMSITEIRFEICPILDIIHFHALVKCDELTQILYTNHWQGYNVDKWRIIDVQEIYNEEGWLSYINKMNNIEGYPT